MTVLQRAAMEVVDFSGVFLGRQNPKEKSAKKICQKIRHPKTKNPPEHNPAKTTGRITKSAAKSTDKSGRQTSKRTLGFLRLRRFAPGGMPSERTFGYPLGLVEAPVLKCTCDPSDATAGNVNGVCFAPSQMAHFKLKVSATRLPIQERAQHFIL